MNKSNITVEVLIYLLKYRGTKIPAKQIANSLCISPRTVYRAIDTLTLSGIPINTQRGRYYDGVWIAQNYIFK